MRPDSPLLFSRPRLLSPIVGLRLLGAAALCAGLASGSGCRERPAETHAELPGRSLTRWTDKTELFIEHRALVVGHEAAFAVHATVLATFKPVASGALSLTLSCAGQPEQTVRAAAPQSPGIFRPVLKPAQPGSCRLVAAIESPQLQDRVELGACEVYASAAAAIAAPAEDEPAGARIPFLKEQQWTTEFATQPVGEADLQPALAAYAELKPVPSRLHKLQAPIAGWLLLEPQVRPGLRVQAGQVLAAIAPRLGSEGDRASLAAAVASARAELEAAEARLRRDEELVTVGAASQQALEEDRARAQTARARLEAASARLRQYQGGAGGGASGAASGFLLRAPAAAVLTAAHAASGGFIEAGQPVLTLLDPAVLWLEARVFEPDLGRVQPQLGSWFTVTGQAAPIPLVEPHGRLLYTSPALDAESRAAAVVFEVDNPGGALRSGQLARAFLPLGPKARSLAIPESAVLEDAGRAVAYVQAEGEAFERRVLSLGARDRGLVAVREGLAPGERLVVRGAYEIRLSSAAGSVPAHGHTH